MREANEGTASWISLGAASVMRPGPVRHVRIASGLVKFHGLAFKTKNAAVWLVLYIVGNAKINATSLATRDKETVTLNMGAVKSLRFKFLILLKIFFMNLLIIKMTNDRGSLFFVLHVHG